MAGRHRRINWLVSQEVVRGVGLERQVAELVDDPQLRLGEVGQAFFQPALGCALASEATSVVAVTNWTA